MANPTRNDEEMRKFGLTPGGDVYVDATVVTLDPLLEPEGTTNDLELKKFTNTGKVRVVLTI